jgi:AcrR family transcriptional regulator
MGNRTRRAGPDAASFRPRKLPRQRRSAAMVEAIVEAAARLLVERGYEGATTRRIAERAGASVGSLYQYFPSRDALVTAVLERHVDEVLDRIAVVLRRVEAAPLDAAVRRLVDAVLELHDGDPGLHDVLMEQLPRADRTALLARIERVLAANFRAFLRARPDVPAFDVERAMSVLARACIPLIHRREADGGGQADRRADDLTLLVLGYVRAAAGIDAAPRRETRIAGSSLGLVLEDEARMRTSPARRG